MISATGVALAALAGCAPSQAQPGKAQPAFTSTGPGPVGTTFPVSDSSGTKLATGKSGTGCVDLPGARRDKVTTVRYGNMVYPGTTAGWSLP